MRRQWSAVIGLCLSSSLTGAAQAAGPVYLQPHRAVYDLTLEHANDNANIDTLDGRMVYEFTGSPCEGYTTNFRFVTRINNGGSERVTDLQTHSFESADGTSFRFSNKTLVDGETSQEVTGSARETGAATLVNLMKPAVKSLTLDASQFPTTHMVEIIGKAEAGDRFYQTTIFDGSEDADKVMDTTVVIGKADTRPETGDEAKAMGRLATEQRWPVSIAYFDPADRGGGLPTFRTTFDLYANGITRNLVMDYGDFAVTGKLVDLKLYDKPDCRK